MAAAVCGVTNDECNSSNATRAEIGCNTAIRFAFVMCLVGGFQFAAVAQRVGDVNSCRVYFRLAS